jgi:hypothetical protein
MKVLINFSLFEITLPPAFVILGSGTFSGIVAEETISISLFHTLYADSRNARIDWSRAAKIWRPNPCGTN